jgi:hypothetical protein
MGRAMRERRSHELYESMKYIKSICRVSDSTDSRGPV